MARTILSPLRRFLVLLAVMFWQGGFTFYAAVVVHVGSEVLGSHLEQGLVTQAVTNYLNLAGLMALLLWGWDIAREPSLSWRRLRWMFWLILAITLCLQASLHPKLDELIDLESHHILDRPRFRELHVWYLNISTAQWAASLVLLAVTLLAWRSEDSKD